MAKMSNPCSRVCFIFYVLSLTLVVSVAQEIELPIFTRQPSCFVPFDLQLKGIKAEVAGAKSLQWLSNNVPVPGGTNATLLYARHSAITNRAAYVLIASNSVGVVPSKIIWSDSCGDFSSGAVRFDSNEQLVLDENGAPWPSGHVTLYMGPALELSESNFGGSTTFVTVLPVQEGRIGSTLLSLPYLPGRKLYGQFRLRNKFDSHDSRSKIFEVTVGRSSNPGLMNTVEPWRYRAADCYGLNYFELESFAMRMGHPAGVRLRFVELACGPFPFVTNYSDGLQLLWRKNGVPIDETHPIVDTNRLVTIADAGVYELYQRDDYYVRVTQYIVPLKKPLKISISQIKDDAVWLSIYNENIGTYRLEQSANLTQWSFVQEITYTNRESVVEMLVAAGESVMFYRLK